MHEYTLLTWHRTQLHTHIISFGIFFVQSGSASFFLFVSDLLLRLRARGDDPRFSSSELSEALDLRFRVSFTACPHTNLMHIPTRAN